MGQIARALLAQASFYGLVEVLGRLKPPHAKKTVVFPSLINPFRCGEERRGHARLTALRLAGTYRYSLARFQGNARHLMPPLRSESSLVNTEIRVLVAGNTHSAKMLPRSTADPAALRWERGRIIAN